MLLNFWGVAIFIAILLLQVCCFSYDDNKTVMSRTAEKLGEPGEMGKNMKKPGN